MSAGTGAVKDAHCAEPMVTRLLLLLIRVYQLTLSPLLGNVCRFYPSCSRYTAACIAHHGPLKGTWLGIKRISRCHPFNPGGYVPPPLPSGQTPQDDGAMQPPQGARDDAAAPAQPGHPSA
jgi:putative membrane protein insertion efficiency factor